MFASATHAKHCALSCRFRLLLMFPIMSRTCMVKCTGSLNILETNKCLCPDGSHLVANSMAEAWLRTSQVTTKSKTSAYRILPHKCHLQLREHPLSDFFKVAMNYRRRVTIICSALDRMELLFRMIPVDAGSFWAWQSMFAIGIIATILQANEFSFER